MIIVAVSSTPGSPASVNFHSIAAGLFVAMTYFNRNPIQPSVSRFSIELPAGGNITAGTVIAAPYPAISPNGRYVVFLAASAGTQRLWLRPIDSLTAQVMPGTEGVATYPFWSPDNQFVGFFAGGKLKKVPIAGVPRRFYVMRKAAEAHGIRMMSSCSNAKVRYTASPRPAESAQPYGRRINPKTKQPTDGPHFFLTAAASFTSPPVPKRAVRKCGWQAWIRRTIGRFLPAIRESCTDIRTISCL